MAISQKELKKEREMVSNLLKANGEDYNHWLHLHHQKYIEENQDLILQALNAFKGAPTQAAEVESKPNEQSQVKQSVEV
ncbi:hypothetical protein CN326_14940 [Bacillus sp. AFS018417]|uniref:hypothetical protein n=1 Tax=Bacillus sp. AFS018417 TaxID=2033491 RepID=UPI000BF7786A|nr:hypothetical protein [Bacillus sp. AFS018417]PEZ05305.1 hypothetical protein CN326_14940 [Bacillus sp. AFS018417]